MILNYFKVAWRTLVRNKTLSLIKILGLSIGLAVCILMFLYSKDELSYDHFHANKGNIYRVFQDMDISVEPKRKLGTTQTPLGEAFEKEIPEVQSACRMLDIPVTIKSKNEVFSENPLTADKNFFSVFSFDLLKGDPKTALEGIYSIVLSESAAKKYFGTEAALGKIIELKTRDEFENFTVTGIIADAPQNSTIRFSMIVPFEFFKKENTHAGWIGGRLNTFLLLKPEADIAAATKKMQAIFDRNTREQIETAEREQKIKVKIVLGLQPLTDIHMNKELGAYNGLAEVSSPAYSYVLSGISIFILLIACINFINLSVGQSLKRSREIGIRKVVGGNRRQLIGQFLTESFLVSLLAFVVALALASAILPMFNELSGKKLALSYLADGWFYLGLGVLLLLTSFLAGLYPALVLSGFNILNILWGRQKLMGKNYFSRGLVVFQFALAIFLIIGTIAVYTQVNFLLKRDLGYDSTNLLRVNLPFSDQNDLMISRLKKELEGKPGIISIASRNKGRWGSGAVADGKQIMIDMNAIDDKYFTTLKIPFKAGRNFSPEFPSDTTASAIVNEAFVQEAGWAGSAIGKTIENMESKQKVTIVGVIKNYHYSSLKEKLGAQVFYFGPQKEYGQVLIKLDGKNMPATLSAIAEQFRALSPFYPFTYEFIDEINTRNYEAEAKWQKVMTISSVIFIFISCIGLFGLVMLSVEQRTREIGIRKIMGAAATRIVLLISKEFTWLVLAGFVVAAPLALYAISYWLRDFPYRVTIHWWTFGFAGLLILLLAWLTISFQAIKAAIANPVNALRTE